MVSPKFSPKINRLSIRVKTIGNRNLVAARPLFQFACVVKKRSRISSFLVCVLTVSLVEYEKDRHSVYDFKQREFPSEMKALYRPTLQNGLSNYVSCSPL